MSKISTTKLASLCHRVGSAYKAGLNVQAIWAREAKHGSPRHRLEMQKVAECISEGRTVAEGLIATNGYFPDLMIAVTEAGEEGGRLERAFELLAQHYRTIVKFRRDMISRLAWPVMELTAAVFIIGALILIMGWVSEQPIDWLGFGWSSTQYFWAWVSLVLLFFGSIAILIIGSKEGWFGDYPMKIAGPIPVVGKTIQIFSLARFAWVLAAAFEAGMNTMRGVGLAFRATQNHFYQQFEEDVKEDLQDGVELTATLRATDAFPEDFLIQLENGELTGNIPESMTRLAEEYTTQAEHNLGIITKVLFFLVFGFVAVVIGFLIVRLYSMYLSGIQELM